MSKYPFVPRERRYHSPKMPKKWPATRKDQAISDLLGMVEVDAAVDVVVKWSDEEAFAAMHWAWKSHLRASDNIVKVPPMPAFLVPYECVTEIIGPSVLDMVRRPKYSTLAPPP